MGAASRSKLIDRFEPTTPVQWRARVEQELEGASFERRLVGETSEGIRTQPLYAATAAQPVTPRALRRSARGWQLCQRIDDLDPRAAAAGARLELAEDIDAIWIETNRLTRLSREPASERGTLLGGRDSFATLLDAIDPRRVAISFDAGANALPVAALLLAEARARAIDGASLRGGLGADPLGALARDGTLPASLERCNSQMADLAGWTSRNAPGLAAVLVSTRPYHDAGAHAVQELAYALATGVEYLRQLTGAGLSIDDSCAQLRFGLCAGRDLFVDLAKLRAARALWRRVAEACGADPAAGRMWLHVQTSWRTKTARDPWVNLLRDTVEGFVAAVGGADAITILPFDVAIGPSDGFARRIARNTSALLAEESNLGRVADPAAGSWYVEQLTSELATRAWTLFQQIEGGGGMGRRLLDGVVARELAEVREGRRTRLANRREPITGVSQYPNLGEEPVTRATRDAARLASRLRRPASSAISLPLTTALGGLTEAAIAAAGAACVADLTRALAGDEAPPRITPLAVRRDAEPFEHLRDVSDARLALVGRRPRLLLVGLGEPHQFKARADFARGFLEAGGVEVCAPGDERLPAGDPTVALAALADGAVICGTDEAYAAQAAEIARKLKGVGARMILIAGRAGDDEAELRAAGVDLFIHLGSDLLAAHAALQAKLGAGQDQ